MQTPANGGWPQKFIRASIKTGDDVDYLGTQGLWVCTLVAVLSFAVYAFTGHEILGATVLLYFFLGGVGVREHSRYVAAVLLISYLVETVAAGPSAVRVFWRRLGVTSSPT